MSDVQDVILDAYREINVVGYDEAMDGQQAVIGLAYLYRMLKVWQATDHLWLIDTQTVTLTTAASYTLAERAVRLHSARLSRDGIETPMHRLTRQEYDDLPLKTSTGVPTCYHLDQQRDSSLLYIWPVLAAADGETIKLTFEREITEPALREGTLDVPGEWYEAVMLGLADRLSKPFERPIADLPMRAAQAYAVALSTDREGSVFFGSDCA